MRVIWPRIDPERQGFTKNNTSLLEGVIIIIIIYRKSIFLIKFFEKIIHICNDFET